MSLFSILLILAACVPATSVTSTATESPAFTAAIEIPPAPETSIPPTATKKEVAAALQLDKPMTTEFDPENTAVMPTIKNVDRDVGSGAVQNALIDYWKAHPELGYYDTQGNVVVPPGVIPISAGDWKTIITPDGRILLIGDWYEKCQNEGFSSCGFRPTSQQLKTVDESINVKSILPIEALYYYANPEDQKNKKASLTPLVYSIDWNMMEQSATMGGIKIKVGYLYDIFGHRKDLPPEVKVEGNPGWEFPTPFLGVQAGKSPNDLNGLNDPENFLKEPMQKNRDAIIQSVNAGTFNPWDLGKVLILPP